MQIQRFLWNHLWGLYDRIIEAAVKGLPKLNKIISLLLFMVVLLIVAWNQTMANMQPATARLSDKTSASIAPPYNLEFLNLVGGSVLATAVQGNYVYAGIGSRFVVFDVSNPATPTPVGEVHLAATIREIELSNGYAAVVISSPYECTYHNPVSLCGGWYVISLNTPSAPELVFYQEDLFSDVVLSDHYLYGVSGSHLLIFDVANPLVPVQVGAYNFSSVDYVTVTHLDVSGRYVYAFSLRSAKLVTATRVMIVDVLDPTSPVLLGQWDGPSLGDVSGAGSLATIDTYTYVSLPSSNGYSSPNLRVLDVSNPQSPTEIEAVELPYLANSITAVANTLYLTHGENGVSRLDISNPVQPTLTGSTDTPGTAVAIAAAGDFAYVADSGRGLRILDTSSLSDLNEIAAYDEVGIVNNITIANSNAYISGHDMRILDLINPQFPLQSGLYETVSETNSIAVSGTMAFLVSNDVQLVDVNNPSNPSQIGEYVTPDIAREVALRQGEMVVANDFGGVQIVDITNPQSPSQVSMYNPWQMVGSVFVSGTYAYAGENSPWNTHTSGLHILDISDGRQPIFISQLLGVHVSGVIVDGDYAFMAASEDGLQIADVANPYQPFLVSSLDTPGTAREVVVSGSTAYVADGDAGLQIISIADMTNPQELSSFPVFGLANHVVVADPYVFLVDSNFLQQASVLVIDVTNPIIPTQVSSFVVDNLITDIFYVANKLYIGTGDTGSMIIIDYSDPANPVELSTFSLPTFAQSLAVSGDYAYITAGNELHIVDVSDPAQPEEVSSYPRGGWEIAVNDNRAYLTLFSAFEIVDVTDPTKPAELAIINSTVPAVTLSSNGDHLFVGSPGHHFVSEQYGLVAINAMTSTQPYQTDYLPGRIRQLSTRGDFAYVLDVDYDVLSGILDGVLTIIDISDPTDLVQVSIYETPGDAQDTAVTGNFVYVADGWAGLRLLDVWDPAQPTIASSLSTPCFAQAVDTLADHVYVGCGEGGLMVARRSQPSITTMVTAVSGGNLTFTDAAGTVTAVQIPPGAVTETVDLVLVPVTSAHGPQGMAVVQAFDLLTYQDGQERVEFTFLQPVTLTITYADTAVAVITDEADLALQWGEQGLWETTGSSCPAPPPVVDEGNNRVTAVICRNNRYALWGPTRQAFLPALARP